MLKDEARGQRIDVVRDGATIPLLPDVPLLADASTWNGVAFEEHYTDSALVISEHEHLSHVLHVQVSGPTPVEWKSRGQARSATLMPDSIFLLPRGTRDSVSWYGPVHHLLISFQTEVLEATAAELDRTKRFELKEEWGFHDRQIGHLVHALRLDTIDRRPAGPLYGESLVHALQVYLLGKYASSSIVPRQYRGGLPGYKLDRVREFINSRLESEISLSAMAAEAGMGKHYFASLFRNSTGLPPHQYVLRKRVERARELLGNRRISVQEAARATGFRDQTHFAKVFARLAGVTPSAYKAQFLKNPARID